MSNAQSTETGLQKLSRCEAVCVHAGSDGLGGAGRAITSAVPGGRRQVPGGLSARCAGMVPQGVQTLFSWIQCVAGCCCNHVLFRDLCAGALSSHADGRTQSFVAAACALQRALWLALASGGPVLLAGSVLIDSWRPSDQPLDHVPCAHGLHAAGCMALALCRVCSGAGMMHWSNVRIRQQTPGGPGGRF